jgi:hypothetical protein
MLPRGEVALIVAGVDLSRDIIGPDLFGVTVLLAILTTVVAPIFLELAFERILSGLRYPPLAFPPGPPVIAAGPSRQRVKMPKRSASSG